MTKSKRNFSTRCRPGLGTLIRVHVDNDALIEPIYTRIAKIEAQFNFHDPTSELSRYNENTLLPLSDDFQRLMAAATELRERSRGAFTPFVAEQEGERLTSFVSAKVDLGGLAKGFAVDEAVSLAQALDHEASGFVEAGGDIRYFGETEARVNLRLGVPPQIFSRELRLRGEKMAVATSSPGTAAEFGESRTRLRDGLWPKGCSVTVVAQTCMLADALTKVVLFGGGQSFKDFDKEADALVFDANGELIEGLMQ